MLKRNIYIMFKAGSMGNYIKWVIDKSEKDSAHDTIDNPLTPQGNTHGHDRHPTHVPHRELIKWLLYRRPHYKQAYLSNPMRTLDKRAEATVQLAESDPGCVIINIHQNNDDLIEKYAYLNQVKTWPVSLKATFNHYSNDETQYHPLDDDDKQRAMVWLYYNWKKYFIANKPTSEHEKDLVLYGFSIRERWFNARQGQLEQMSQDEYPVLTEFPKNYYDLCVTDIVADNFIETISKILTDADAGEFDFSHAADFHPSFQDAKPNKEWFNHIEKYRSTGEIDPWFSEHILSQAFLLTELPVLPDNWEQMSYDEIILKLE